MSDVAGCACVSVVVVVVGVGVVCSMDCCSEDDDGDEDEVEKEAEEEEEQEEEEAEEEEEEEGGEEISSNVTKEVRAEEMGEGPVGEGGSGRAEIWCIDFEDVITFFPPPPPRERWEALCSRSCDVGACAFSASHSEKVLAPPLCSWRDEDRKCEEVRF